MLWQLYRNQGKSLFWLNSDFVYIGDAYDKALKILRLQAEGLSVEKIAEKLGLSKAGVKYYNQETYKKLGVNNRTAAVAEARNRRLL